MANTSSRIPGNLGRKEDSTSTTAPGQSGYTAQGSSSLGQKAQDFGQKAQESASDLGHKAQGMASDVAHKAQDAASNLGQKAKDVASIATEKTDDAISSVGERMSSWAGSIREKAPHEGVVGSAASAIANRMDAGGHYLQAHGLSEMTDDLESVIRRYPMQSLLVGFGVGCLIGLAFSRR